MTLIMKIVSLAAYAEASRWATRQCTKPGNPCKLVDNDIGADPLEDHYPGYRWIDQYDFTNMDFLMHKGTCRSIIDWINKTPCLDNTTYTCEKVCDGFPATMDLYCTFLVGGDVGYTTQYAAGMTDAASIDSATRNTFIQLADGAAACCPYLFIRLVNPEDDLPRPGVGDAFTDETMATQAATCMRGTDMATC